jgi:hypothetical protein
MGRERAARDERTRGPVEHAHALVVGEVLEQAERVDGVVPPDRHGAFGAG